MCTQSTPAAVALNANCLQLSLRRPQPGDQARWFAETRSLARVEEPHQKRQLLSNSCLLPRPVRFELSGCWPSWYGRMCYINRKFQICLRLVCPPDAQCVRPETSGIRKNNSIPAIDSARDGAR
eukprot:scaffold133023_cov32-Tisochrysis_lutea.AAC.4